ncbi:Hypothetical predicted protein [Paramuricea clavata]|uniref:Uncharacterized protein n=1 Tax=Paramuricea clavata TaxID=317549 RepID=A0A7D9M1D3_PARCT|nr:Hypothetical predicted protein [Paramuricea clavata]
MAFRVTSGTDGDIKKLKLENDAWSCNMGRGFNFRLLYRVVFFSFCLIFACFYHGGGSEYDRRENKVKKLKDEFKDKPLNVDVSLEQDERVSNLIENAKQIDGRKARKKTDLSKIVRKGTPMKTLRSERIQKSPVLPFSTPSPSEVNVPRKESTTISHSNETEWKNDGSKNISLLGKKMFHQNYFRETAKRETFASFTTQHLRSRREIDAILESPTECANFTFTIKYEDIYRVWNNFSMMYQSRMYRYNEYRVTDDDLQVCNSSDPLIKQRWPGLVAREKKVLASKYCNVSVVVFYNSNYTLYRNLSVFFKPTQQSFTRQDYGVTFGYFAICSAKLSLSYNNSLVKDGKPHIWEEKNLRTTSTEYTLEDLLICIHSIINIKYDDEYKVRTDFSILYKNKMYDYTEYRVLNDSIKICNSTDNYVRNIWKVRNKRVKLTMHYKSCNEPIKDFLSHRQYYTVNKQFTVYFVTTSQYFKRNDYGVQYGKPAICQEKFKPTSTEYTQEDLLMCNDSIINITYDDEYKVRTDFSILYKNNVYDYTEYRVLNDSIKICNSTDNYVRNIWKLRNKWVKAKMHQKGCSKPNRESLLNQKYYTVNKQFTVYDAPWSQYFTRNEYGVHDGKLHICKEKFKPTSTEYTREDLLMCNDSIINIKYDDEYKVRTNFSILYKNKVYHYTKY